MADRTPIETAALDWARERIRLTNIDSKEMPPQTLETMQRERHAQARLLAICTQELARLEGTILDLSPTDSPKELPPPREPK